MLVIFACERTEPIEAVASSAPAYETVKNDVLSKVSEVLDSEKPATVDEADPYVLALALELQRAGRTVRVITEETRNRPNKLALSTAAGLLGLAAVTLPAFLMTQGPERATHRGVVEGKFCCIASVSFRLGRGRQGRHRRTQIDHKTTAPRGGR